MPRDRPGFHTAGFELPQVLWDRMEADAEEAGHSVTKELIRILAKHFQVPLSSLPKDGRRGRKPKNQGLA